MSRENAKGKINYKKLFFETIFSLAAVFIAALCMLAPNISAKMEQSDKYERFRYILEEVDNYDYEKGRNRELETRLDKKYGEVEKEEKFFYGLARATYYCNVGYYRTAEWAFLGLIYDDIDESEQLEAEKRKVICERKENEE